MRLEITKDNQKTLVQLNENLKTWYLLLMKSKLTEQQKINEILSKVFSFLIKKKMSRTTQDMINKNPKVKKSVDNLNRGIDDFKDAFRDAYGDDFADRVEKELRKV